MYVNTKLKQAQTYYSSTYAYMNGELYLARFVHWILRNTIFLRIQ